jgi:hypothetical protein
MTEDELGRPLCRMPFAGITINPTGHVVLCCSATNTPLAHISEIEDVDHWFNTNQDLIDVRNEMLVNKRLAHHCIDCFNYKTETVAMDTWVRNTIDWDSQAHDNNYYNVKFLEITFSNLCNQTCVMCGSFFSSKWVKLDKKAINSGLNFRSKQLKYLKEPSVNTIDDDQIEKINKIAAKVDNVVLKGGEPFADYRNIDLINFCNTMNRPPRILILTNFTNLNDHAFNTIAQYNGPLAISISVDGIDKQYEWVRSSSFTKLLNNIKRLEDIQQFRPNITLSFGLSPSIYTVFNLIEAASFWLKQPTTSHIWIKPVIGPTYTSMSILDGNVLKELQSKWKDWIATQDPTRLMIHSALLNLRPLAELDREDRFRKVDHFWSWTEFINAQRGFNIEDIVLELNRV